MKTFVFAIGGTGARVLRAVTMFMAMDLDVPGEIIPIVIDMDLKNGDTSRTIKLLDDYRTVSTSAYGENRPDSGFFRNKLGTLGTIVAKGEKKELDGVGDGFQLDFGEIETTFNNYIQGNHLGSLDTDFLSSLFDDSPSDQPRTELNLKLHHGFKGNPNIGSIVFNNLINTPEFRYFENVFSEEDRIFIISSIFGGTGSSGFPQLVKNIRNSNNNYIKQAPIGALVVKPYFRVKKDGASSIDSDTFNSKTKSALTYYAQEIDDDIDAVYYLGDTPGNAIENNMGGAEQKNSAHVIEVLGASALMHYLRQSDTTLRSKSKDAYEFGYLSPNNGVTTDRLQIKHLSEDREWTALVEFALFAKYFREGLDPRDDEDFFKDMQIGELRKEKFHKHLAQFVDSFYEWVSELRNNTRAFDPVNLEGEFKNFMKHDKIGDFEKKFLSDKFTKNMNNRGKAEETNRERHLLASMHHAVDALLKKHIDKVYV